MQRALALVCTATMPDWVEALRPALVIGCGLALVLARQPLPL